MEQRTPDQIHELGMEALVAALGRADTEVFLRQVADVATSKPQSQPAGGATPPGDADAAEATTNPAPPLTAQENHDQIRDLQDPREQQSLL